MHALQNGVFHNVRLLDTLQYTQESLHVINVFNLVAKEGLLSSNEGRKGHRIYLWHGSRDSVVPGINAINSYNFLRQLLPPSASIYLDNKVPTVFENHQKCLISNFQLWCFPQIFVPLEVTCLVTRKSLKNFDHFWHFPPLFILSKLTIMVTLFDRKSGVFKKFAKIGHFWQFQ